MAKNPQAQSRSVQGVVKRGPCTFWATRYVGALIYWFCYIQVDSTLRMPSCEWPTTNLTLEFVRVIGLRLLGCSVLLPFFSRSIIVDNCCFKMKSYLLKVLNRVLTELCLYTYGFPYEKSVQNFLIQQSVQNVLYLLPHPTNYKKRNCNISKKNYAVPDLKTELVQ